MTLKQKIAISYIRAKFKILSAISKKKAAASAFELFCTPQYRNLKELPPVFQTSEKISVRFLDYTISGYRWNKGGMRKALIIHGFESSVVNFDNYVTAFIDKGHEVLAFDAPAHGRSSGKQVNAIIYRDLLKFAWENYGPFHIFTGHSFGGLVSCMCLAEVEHDIDFRLVLIAPATDTQTALDQFFGLIGVKDDIIRSEFERIINRVGGHPVSWYSIERAIKQIKAQVLWVHDEDDKTTPVEGAYKVRRGEYGNIRFLITSGLGHRRIYRDTGVLKAVVEFAGN